MILPIWNNKHEEWLHWFDIRERIQWIWCPHGLQEPFPVQMNVYMDSKLIPQLSWNSFSMHIQRADSQTRFLNACTNKFHSRKLSSADLLPLVNPPEHLPQRLESWPVIRTLSPSLLQHLQQYITLCALDNRPAWSTIAIHDFVQYFWSERVPTQICI